MHVVGRISAALLFAFFAGHGAIPAAYAAHSAKSPCAHSVYYGKRCVSTLRRDSKQRAATSRQVVREAWPQRRAASGWPQWARRRFIGGDATGMAQLSPRLRPRSVSRLRFDDDRGFCGGREGRRVPCQRSLADALLQSPDASTEKLLRETGIPSIPGVPPIIILRSAAERHHHGRFRAGSH